MVCGGWFGGMPLTLSVQRRLSRFWLAACWRWWDWSGRSDRALATLDELLASCEPLDPHLLATRAHALGSLNRWAAARSDLEQLCALCPHHAAHHYNLGFVCMQMGDGASAVQAFGQSVTLNPRLDQGWYGLGGARMAVGDWRGAEDAWRKQVQLQPLCPDGYVRLIELFVSRGDFDSARSWWNRLSHFDPRRAFELQPVLPESGAVRWARGGQVECT